MSETKRLNELVTMLLECARPRSPQFDKQSLHQIIEHTLELLQTQLSGKAIRLTSRLNASEPMLYCDRDQLIQVFLNLVTNAIQHVARGGLIELTTRYQAGQLETLVCDNGSGISDASKSRVFEPFFTGRQDGIGLGLTVVQQIILAHRGKIFVTDNLSGGACFHVVLPSVHIQEP